MRDIFVTLVVFGSLPLILWRPFYGIIMWTWLGYMNPHRMAWGFSTTMPFAMMVALTTLIALLISKEPKKIPWTRETVLLLLFVIWMCITTYFAFRPDLAVEQLDKVLKIQFMTFVALILLTSRERIHALVWTVALSLGFYGIKGGIFTVLTGGGFHVQGPPGTFIGGNNELGLALLMTIPLMRYLQVEESRQWLKLGLTGAIVLTLVAVLGTQSRGALVGLVVMGSIFVWKSPRRATFILLAAVAVPLVLGFMPESWWARMDTINNYQEDASSMQRIEAWKHAWSIGTTYVMGGGFEANVASGARDVHSIYFEVLGEQGFPGLAMFLSLLAFTWLSAGWIIRHAKKHGELKWAENLARMLQVSGVAYCTSGIFLGMAYFDYIYLLVALVVATRQLVASHLAAQAPATQSAFATQVRPRRRDFNPADAGRISARRGSGFNPTFPSA
ncbi:MAG TPA: putative O-glycosylation ligase, exosortase A system-associated [Pseudomonadales bacterium]|nr:putative O-glycosylation ligase, exosortase A system-associated [Pseudomonadales bacterium]